MRNAERAEASSSLKLSTQVYVANIFTERTLVSFRKDTAYIIGLFFFCCFFLKALGLPYTTSPVPHSVLLRSLENSGQRRALGS